MSRERISMPMTSAGILGIGSDMKIAGIEIDPRGIVLAAIVFVVLVKVLGIVLASSAIQ